MNYKIYLVYKNEREIIYEGSLQSIDAFTTAFKNTDVLKKKLFENIDFDSSKFFIKIEGPKHANYNFIGSDFKNVIKNFNSNGYRNAVCSLDEEILIDYFEEYFDNILINYSGNMDALNNKIDEYQQNKQIPFMNALNSLKKIVELKENNQEFNNEKVNANYNIRKHIGEYKYHRDMYQYLVGNGFVDQEEIKYTKEEAKNINSILEEARKRTANFVYKIETMGFVQQDLDFVKKEDELKEAPVKEEDMDINLEYIGEMPSNDEIFIQSTKNAYNVSKEDKMDTISTYVEDPEEREKLLKEQILK